MINEEETRKEAEPGMKFLKTFAEFRKEAEELQQEKSKGAKEIPDATSKKEDKPFVAGKLKKMEEMEQADSEPEPAVNEEVAKADEVVFADIEKMDVNAKVAAIKKADSALGAKLTPQFVKEKENLINTYYFQLAKSGKIK